MRVLIADGDKEFLKQARFILLQRGHEAEIACDGLECADILCDFRTGYRGVRP